jgi:hypothetical protein
MAPFFSVSHVFSSILLLLVRIWRSVNLPKRDQRRRENLEERQFEHEPRTGAFTRPAEDARDLLRRTRP